MDKKEKEQEFKKESLSALKHLLEMSDKGGFVYLMEVPELGVCKIGLTQKDPTKRRDAIAIGLPFEITTIRCIGTLDVFQTENLVHEFLHRKRMRGEWFKGTIKQFVPVVKRISNEVSSKIYYASNTQSG